MIDAHPVGKSDEDDNLSGARDAAALEMLPCRCRHLDHDHSAGFVVYTQYELASHLKALPGCTSIGFLGYQYP